MNDVRDCLQNPARVELSKGKIIFYSESAYFVCHEVALTMSRYREKIVATIYLLGASTHDNFLTGLRRRSLKHIFILGKYTITKIIHIRIQK